MGALRVAKSPSKVEGFEIPVAPRHLSLSQSFAGSRLPARTQAGSERERDPLLILETSSSWVNLFFRFGGAGLVSALNHQP